MTNEAMGLRTWPFRKGVLRDSHRNSETRMPGGGKEGEGRNPDWNGITPPPVADPMLHFQILASRKQTDHSTPSVTNRGLQSTAAVHTRDRVIARPNDEPAPSTLIMTIPEILKELELYTRRFPREALRAAIDQREAITPELLRVVEEIAANPAEYAPRGDCMLPVFALYLLAQFREKQAYPAIVKMFYAPGETSFDLAGDTVTEGLKQIFASVYDGNPGPLHGLIENEQANEYVRDAAIRALLVLENTGQMPRAEVVEYLRSLFRGKLERTPSFAWDGLVSAVGDLPAPELLEEVREAYAEGLADEGVASLDDIERDVAAAKTWRRKHDTLITDAIGEMEHWACFHPEESPPTDLPRTDSPEVSVPVAPPTPPVPVTYEPARSFVRGPKIGRNDPCPCGSGKKYKKCCGKG